ncbi:hypothetical protein L618_001600000160 [Rhodococcus rhodochrous J45]|uniref:Uncharacterized protein n=2 Tax=Nocardiaceae TaxID=85025 RepID=A0A562E788_RHORH|nr:hypothetical protein L618_001600000160 [Rhodococcus rhodochrous J45]
MKVGSRYSVLATWPGAFYEHTTKVTTLDSADSANDLAVALTSLSEAAWDATVWTDAYPVIPPAIAALVDSLRQGESGDGVPAIELSGEGYRHADTWSFNQLRDQLAGEFDVFPPLTRTQRLTMADEIATDAAERGMLMESPGGVFADDSRVHQACLVTRVEENGSRGPLPEGAAGWMRRFYPENMPLHERWSARGQLLRMEQLAAACNSRGGRARASTDPLSAHCVVAVEPDRISDGDIPYVVTPLGPDEGWFDVPNPLGPLYVRRDREWIGELDPADGEGFAAVMGEWTRAVPYLA